MSEEVEITSFDLRYQRCRMKAASVEKALLSSILEHGIREPLQGVDSGDVRILLNGFKRYRCGRKLGITIVPYASLGRDEAFGIIRLLRIANARNLSILEQARLIDELKNVHGMNVTEIARLLERSNAWVSMRVGLVAQMSPLVLDKVFSGQFPAYAFLYTLRRFIRMKGVRTKEVDAFVRAVSGKGLSIRDIELLARGYFMGTQELREQIDNGDVVWGLKLLKEPAGHGDGCTPAEKKTLRDLEILQAYIQRAICGIKDKRLGSNAFLAQAHLLTGGILGCLDAFSAAIKELHDRCGHAHGGRHPS